VSLEKAIYRTKSSPAEYLARLISATADNRKISGAVRKAG
jgi:hypothetical protein